MNRNDGSHAVGAALALMLALALACALMGCAKGGADASTASTARLWGYRGNTIAWVSDAGINVCAGVLVDQETGVEYLIVSKDDSRAGVSVTPLLNADGTPFKAVE